MINDDYDLDKITKIVQVVSTLCNVKLNEHPIHKYTTEPVVCFLIAQLIINSVSDISCYFIYLNMDRY